MATTWNPSDLASATLSSGNLVATSTAGSGGVRTPDRYWTGKYYWEVTFTTLPSASNTCAGISIAGAAFNSLAASATNGIGLFASGAITMNGATQVSGFGTIAAGSVVCLAVDIDKRLFWARVGAAGNWNNSAFANPATGVGGVSFVALSANAMYAWDALGSGSGFVHTANFGGSAFAGAVPGGFTSGLPSPNVPPLYAAETQAALEQWSSPNPQSWATQVALEQWGLTGTVGTQAITTQVGLEEWANIAAVTPGVTQARVMVMA